MIILYVIIYIIHIVYVCVHECMYCLNWCLCIHKIICTTVCIHLYTYTQQGECRSSGFPTTASMSGIVSIPRGDEQALLQAVATVGPVAAAVDATSNAFRVNWSKLSYYYKIWMTCALY